MSKSMSFEFATAQRIVFKRGSAGDVASWSVKLGRTARSSSGRRRGGGGARGAGGGDDEVEGPVKVLVVTGRAGLDRPSLMQAKSSLDAVPDDIQYRVFRLFEGAGGTGAEEPTVSMAGDAVDAAVEFGAELVVGIGGGSAIDTGKAVAALVPQPGSLLDYMEVVGRSLPLEESPLPFIAVPTTAGTGSEATKNSVFDDPTMNVKASLRDNSMLPTLAIIDPLLTVSVPKSVTAATGLDALTQNIEPFVSNTTTPITDAITLEAIQRCARSLLRCYETGNDVDAREDMCVASLFGGIAVREEATHALTHFSRFLVLIAPRDKRILRDERHQSALLDSCGAPHLLAT